MINMNISQHAVAFPSKVLASNGGAHIFNITLTEDVDNGFFVAKGAWQELDRYAQAKVTPETTAIGVVRDVAANGNYYVEITADLGAALFVYQVPMIEEEYSNVFKKESNFYNANGDTVRAYELKIGDIIEVSAAAFANKVAKNDPVKLVAISGKNAVQLSK